MIASIIEFHFCYSQKIISHGGYQYSVLEYIILLTEFIPWWIAQITDLYYWVSGSDNCLIESPVFVYFSLLLISMNALTDDIIIILSVGVLSAVKLRKTLYTNFSFFSFFVDFLIYPNWIHFTVMFWWWISTVSDFFQRHMTLLVKTWCVLELMH